MSSNGDCSLRKDWCEEVDDEESLSSNNQERVGHKHDCFHGNGTHVGQVKDKLEEELTRLTLVITENKRLLQDMLTSIQETDEELRLVLGLIRTDLEQSSTESEVSGEANKKSKMEQEIMTHLTELVEGQEEIKSKLSEQSQIEDLTKIVETMTLEQNDQERKSVLRCYYCHEEGHLKRNCPQRINRRRTQSQVFRQYPQRINKEWQSQPFTPRTAFRHRYNTDEMQGEMSMSWPIEGRNDTEVINTGQIRRENIIVSCNPLN